MLYRKSWHFIAIRHKKGRLKIQINSRMAITKMLSSIEGFLLTSQHFNNQIHIRTEFLDMIKICYCHYWHILITVHLWDKVHVTGKIFSVGRGKKNNRGNTTDVTFAKKIETKIHHVLEGRFLLWISFHYFHQLLSPLTYYILLPRKHESAMQQ